MINQTMIKPKFTIGDIVIYQNGDNYELGEVKQVIIHEQRTYTKEQDFPPKGKPEGKVVLAVDYYVNYHTGETAARTPEDCLHSIKNLYAFDVKRKHVDFPDLDPTLPIKNWRKD